MNTNNLKLCSLTVAALVLIGACSLPTGSGDTEGAKYADNLASFQQEVGELALGQGDGSIHVVTSLQPFNTTIGSSRTSGLTRSASSSSTSRTSR